MNKVIEAINPIQYEFKFNKTVFIIFFPISEEVSESSSLVVSFLPSFSEDIILFSPPFSSYFSWFLTSSGISLSSLMSFVS